MKLPYDDCCRITTALGMALGEKHSDDDDATGLGFTVAGGCLTNGDRAPEWLARLNGSPVEDIAAEALKRNAIQRADRWRWRKL